MLVPFDWIGDAARAPYVQHVVDSMRKKHVRMVLAVTHIDEFVPDVAMNAAVVEKNAQLRALRERAIKWCGLTGASVLLVQNLHDARLDWDVLSLVWQVVRVAVERACDTLSDPGFQRRVNNKEE